MDSPQIAVNPNRDDPPRPPVITLTTDFGLRDTYVGQMKGVILSIAPAARIVDLTHEIPPHDVMAGALAIASATNAFAPGTIHVGVVDPGVGTDRAAIAVRTECGIYVGPDNGLFTSVLGAHAVCSAVSLTHTAYHRPVVSRTFHGRDIFAPVAGHLAMGTPLARMGEPITTPLLLEIPTPCRTPHGLELRVLVIDRFGNLTTNLDSSGLDAFRSQSGDAPFTVDIAGRSITSIQQTFGDVAPGKLVCYFGSSGRLEIAVRDGNAARELGAGPQTVILLKAIDRADS